MPKLFDIVRFSDEANCDAAVWCRERSITGVIRDISDDTYVVDVGLPYNIYAGVSDLVVIASTFDAPLSEEAIDDIITKE